MTKMSRDICKTEGCTNLATSVGKRTNGSTKYGNLCSSCKKKPWQSYKGVCCENCGFIPEHPCQLDVDHKDGNKNNNDPSNYQTLCANCHRLKTHLSKDYINRDGL